MASSRGEIEDPLGIYDVVAAYCQAYDSHDREELARVFSPDAVLHILGGASRGDEAVGRENVLAWLTGRWPSAPPCLHLTGNLRFSPAGDGAEGTADFLFLIKKEDGSLQISTAGRYLDRYARHEGRWVIAERSITFLGEPV
jgi:ketosteroid isomerase-like protein